MKALDRRGSPTLHQRHLTWLVIHRISLARFDELANPDPIPDHLLTGAELVKRFENRALGTGGWTPYHALIRTDGVLEQLLRLGVRGAHATDIRPNPKWYNWRTLAIAVAGNTDKHPPTQKQSASLVQVVADLLPLCGKLTGHTDLPGASDDPRKHCPGQYLHLHPAQTTAVFKLPGGWQGWDRAASRACAVAGGWEF